MIDRRIYVLGAAQVSVQEPLSSSWLDHPVPLEGGYLRARDPQWRDYLSALQLRRMGPILRRAMVTSQAALDGAVPEAIMTGTGLGCIEHTEQFLTDLCTGGEEMLSPAGFMQSTHNTVGSLVAIQTRNHGYNCTYSQGSLSFESALLDAFVQLRLGKIHSALVGGHDETTPKTYQVVAHTCLSEGTVPVTEGSAALYLSDSPDREPLCALTGMGIVRGADPAEFLPHLEKAARPDVIFAGRCGRRDVDAWYNAVLEAYPGVPVLDYKQLFGEFFSVSALGIYAAATCLSQGKLPVAPACGTEVAELRKILFINHYEGAFASYAVFEKPCGD